MYTSHELIRTMALRLSDETSHFTREELRGNAEARYKKANMDFHMLLESIKNDKLSDKLHEAAMTMTYAYGDLLGEKGIKMGMRFIAEQVFAPDDENKRPI